jgi:hypothetical protein
MLSVYTVPQLSNGTTNLYESWHIYTTPEPTSMENPSHQSVFAFVPPIVARQRCGKTLARQ